MIYSRSIRQWSDSRRWLVVCWRDRCEESVDPDVESVGLCSEHLEELKEVPALGAQEI